MLDSLSRRDEADVLDFGTSFLRDHLFSFFDQTQHGLTLFAIRLLAQFREDLLKPGGVFLGLFEVRLKTGSERRGVRGFCHSGQSLDELIFRAVEILELFYEKLF